MYKLYISTIQSYIQVGEFDKKSDLNKGTKDLVKLLKSMGNEIKTIEHLTTENVVYI